MFKFQPYGPFKVPVFEGEVVKSELPDFWKEIEHHHPGLQGAVGCYIFATQGRGKPRPWYVGKTEKASFKKEAFQLQKLEHYRSILKFTQRGTPQLFLVAKMTSKGKFRRPSIKRVPPISKLEELFIGACLVQNPKLENKSMTKHLKEIHVPGYMNETPGARSREAKSFAALLGTQKQKKPTPA